MLGGHHDVERPSAPAAAGRSAARWPGRSRRAQRADVGAAEALAEHLHLAGRRVEVERRRSARCSSCPSRCGPSTTQRSPARTSQSIVVEDAPGRRGRAARPRSAQDGVDVAHAGAVIGSSSRWGPPGGERGRARRRRCRRRGRRASPGTPIERRQADEVDRRVDDVHGHEAAGVDRVALHAPQVVLEDEVLAVVHHGEHDRQPLVGRGPQRLRRVHGRPVADDAQHRRLPPWASDTPSAAGMPQPSPPPLQKK